jgi:hypothetical protein
MVPECPLPCSQNTTLLAYVRSQINPLHILTNQVFQVVTFLLILRLKYCVYSRSVQHMPWLSYPSWFGQLSNIWWRVQAMQFLILWFSPAFCCFLHFRSRVLLDFPLYVRRLLEAVNVLIALQAISERQSPPKICMGSTLCLDQLWGPPSLQSNGVLSLGVNFCQGVTLTTHPIYFRGQETVGAYILSSLAPVWCVWDRFTLLFACYGDHMVLMFFLGIVW